MGRRQQSSRQVLLASLPSPGACGLGRPPSRNRAAGLSTSCQAQTYRLSSLLRPTLSPLLTAEEAWSLGCLRRGCFAAGSPYKPNSPTTHHSERLACGCLRPAPYSAPSHTHVSVTQETERGPWTLAPCAWEECTDAQLSMAWRAQALCLPPRSSRHVSPSPHLCDLAGFGLHHKISCLILYRI